MMKPAVRIDSFKLDYVLRDAISKIEFLGNKLRVCLAFGILATYRSLHETPPCQTDSSGCPS